MACFYMCCIGFIRFMRFNSCVCVVKTCNDGHASPPISLQDRLLNRIANCAQESRSRGAVHHAVIEGQAQGHYVARLDAVFNNRWLSPDTTDAEDGALRQMEIGRASCRE